MKLLSVVVIFVIVTGALGAFAQEYRPVDKAFWGDVTDALKEDNLGKILKMVDEKGDTAKRDSLEYAEAMLAAGMAVAKAKLTFAATIIFGDIIKTKLGTQVANQALAGLDDIARQYPVDEDYVFGELINDLEFDLTDASAKDFVNFQQGMYNLLKGYGAWSDSEFKSITVDSYWDFKLRYLTALGEVARDRIDSAIERFSGIMSSQNAPADIKNEATHQFARLLFEKGDYPQAYKVFRTISLNPRERGLILLERAWAKYYEKDYSKALGLLAALEAPIFDTSRSPEPYILRMVMYKELCHYEAAFKVFAEFNNRFGAALRAIRRRQDLRKDQMLVNLSLLDRRVEKWVDFLNLLKEERDSFREYSWEKYPFFKSVKTKYDLKIREITEKLNWILTDKVREEANQLLDWNEQLVFLDYQTRLDSLRVIRPPGEVEYKPEEIPHMTFNKIFWQSTGEYWLDELENYKVFVESRCSMTEAPKK